MYRREGEGVGELVPPRTIMSQVLEPLEEVQILPRSQLLQVHQELHSCRSRCSKVSALEPVTPLYPWLRLRLPSLEVSEVKMRCSSSHWNR